MKVQLGKFTKILDILSVDWELDPVELIFDKEGVRISQLDESSTLMVFATISPSIFSEYDSIGRIMVSYEQYKMLDKAFKGDEFVTIELQNNELVFSGKTESLNLHLIEDEINRANDISIERKPYGLVLAKAPVKMAYYVDLSDLHKITSDTIRFDYNSNSLRAIIDAPAYRYAKSIPYTRSDGDSQGSVTLYASTLNKITRIKDKAWLIFTDGPVEIYYECDDYKVLFALAPVEVGQ